jgi:hypothetical protein
MSDLLRDSRLSLPGCEFMHELERDPISGGVFLLLAG